MLFIYILLLFYQVDSYESMNRVYEIFTILCKLLSLITLPLKILEHIVITLRLCLTKVMGS